jgi:hypothetical protein
MIPEDLIFAYVAFLLLLFIALMFYVIASEWATLFPRNANKSWNFLREDLCHVHKIFCMSYSKILYWADLRDPKKIRGIWGYFGKSLFFPCYYVIPCVNVSDPA